MKILKRIGLILLLIIAILLIVAAIAPKDFHAERSIVINKPKAEVFDYLKHIKNQDNYGKWQLSDPGMAHEYVGEDGTVGFVSKWQSKKMGDGSQKIVGIDEGHRLDLLLDFGFGDPAEAYFVTSDAGTNQTKVIWGIKGRNAWPFNIMHLFYDMGADFDTGLQNLKGILEKN